MAATTLLHGSHLRATLVYEPDGTIRSVDNTPSIIQIPSNGPGGANRIWILELECEIGNSGTGAITASLGNSTAAPALSISFTGGEVQTSAAGELPLDATMSAGTVKIKNRIYTSSKTHLNVGQEITRNNITTQHFFTAPLHETENPTAWSGLTIQLAGDAAIKASLRSVTQSLLIIK
jgi:hypothetical protein